MDPQPAGTRGSWRTGVSSSDLSRMLGYVFSPVSFWYCHDAPAARAAPLAEVNNTFGEIAPIACCCRRMENHHCRADADGASLPCRHFMAVNGFYVSASDRTQRLYQRASTITPMQGTRRFAAYGDHQPAATAGRQGRWAAFLPIWHARCRRPYPLAGAAPVAGACLSSANPRPRPRNNKIAMRSIPRCCRRRASFRLPGTPERAAERPAAGKG